MDVRWTVLALAIASLAAAVAAGHRNPEPDLSGTRDSGYRGIWFTLGQYQSAYGDKYSGGLGTYTANHLPMAVYSPRARKTFLTWGGTKPGRRHLLIMASYYDHRTGLVPRPTIVHDKQGVNDPHDNASICLDSTDHVWIFVSGRGRARPGYLYRSVRPLSVDAFRLVASREMTYPQPWYFPGRGFLHLFTRYTAGRELYWETSPDGESWSPARKLAGIGGHYQVSQRHGGTLVTAFMRHPGGDVDKRTDLYVVKTSDMGRTWTTVDGNALSVPLQTPDNPARVRSYSSEGKLVYINDVSFDRKGNPIVLYVVSGAAEPGPRGGPRVWTTARWTGDEWEFREVTRSDHNYDMGSLYVEADGTWKVIGPTEPGPQPYGTGGEMAAWLSRDEGKTWRKLADLTRGSIYNHSYARRPLNADPGFYAFWADGHAFQESPSRLYFTNRACDRVWRLPTTMEGDFARPDVWWTEGRPVEKGR